MNTTFVTVGVLLVIKLACSSDDKPDLLDLEDQLWSIESEVQRFANIVEEYIIQQSNPRKKFKRSKSEDRAEKCEESKDTHLATESKLNLEGLKVQVDEDGHFDFVPTLKSEPELKINDEPVKSRDSKVYVAQGNPEKAYKTKEYSSAQKYPRRSKSANRSGKHRKRGNKEDSNSDVEVPKKSKYKGYPFKDEDKKKKLPKYREEEESDEEIIFLTKNLSKATLEDERLGARRKVRSNSEERYNKQVHKGLAEDSDEEEQKKTTKETDEKSHKKLKVT